MLCKLYNTYPTNFARNIFALAAAWGTVTIESAADEMTSRPMKRTLSTLRTAFVMLGATGMIAAYYVWHKPLPLSAIPALLGATTDLLALGLLFTACGGVGRTLLVFAPTEQLTRAERVGLEGIIGFGGLSWVALGIGVGGVFTPVTLRAALVLVLLATLTGTASYSRDVWALLRGLSLPAGRWPRFLVMATAFWLLTGLAFALMPPTAWDSLMYHMLLPRRLLQTGQLVTYPDNHYLGFPQTGEVMFAWAMGLFGRETVAAGVHYGAGLLGLVTVGGLLARAVPARAVALAPALLLSGGSFWLAFTQEYVDLILFAQSAAALAALVAWRTHGDRAWLVVMGLLAGMAVGVKYTAGLLAIALGVAILLTQPRRVLVNGAVLTGVALLAYLPWGLRGWIQYSNPFFPFFVGGVGFSAEQAATFGGAGDGLLALGPGGLWRMALLPFVATAVGTEGGLRYSFDAGVWVIPLGVLVPLGWHKLTEGEKTLSKTTALLLVPMLVMWVAGSAFSGIGAQTRLVIPAFPAFVVLSVLGFEALARWGTRPINIYFVVQALVVFALVGGVLNVLAATVNRNPLRVILTDVPVTNARNDYLLANLGTHYLALPQLDNELPPGTRVKFVFEPRAYYCPPTLTCDPDALTDHWAYPLTQGQSPDDVMAAWQTEADAVLLWRQGYTFYTEDPAVTSYKAENALLAPTLDEHMQLIWQDDFGSYELYTWKDD
jgi:hypothetical protein